MFLYGRKNLILIFLINNINKMHSNSILHQNTNMFNHLNKKDSDFPKPKKTFLIKLKKGVGKSYTYRPSFDFIDCYNDNANKSVLINKNYYKRALHFLNKLEDSSFQNEFKKNPDEILKDHSLTPNEISFILFKLYHPKDYNFDQSIIEAVLKSSSLEFKKESFIEYQREFDNILTQYKDLEKLKNGATEEQIDQINKQLREKREDLQLTPLMVLLDNLAFPIKNAKNCFNVWLQCNYTLRCVLGYKVLSPAGLCYFLLCILKNPSLYNYKEISYCLSKKIDETKLRIISDSRFHLEDFLESNSKQSPFDFYKDKFELMFLSVFKNV